MKKFDKEVYLKWYEDMLFWRKFEDKLAAVYIQQKVRGFLHLYNGQEAVAAGCLHAIDPTKDKMITSYRCHVHPIGLGVDPRRIWLNYTAKVLVLRSVWVDQCTFSQKNIIFMVVMVSWADK